MAVPARTPFKTGDEVEVSSDEDGFRGAWYEACVARFMPKLSRYTIDYSTIVVDAQDCRPLRETVPASHVRPRPPRLRSPRGQRLAIHQPVDAYHNDGWWTGVLSDIQGDKYTVCFPITRETIVFRAPEVRAHLEWINGRWVVPDPKGTTEAMFPVGTQVEVARIEQNIPVAWFPAIIVKTIWNSYFQLEYYAKELQREIVGSQHIRPPPPQTLDIKDFCKFDEVEAFYCNGWWSGVISLIGDGPVYHVKSKHWVEDIKFSRTELRLRYDWVDGRWLRLTRRMKTTELREGMLAEVSSDDEGFRGAWFTATILELIGRNKFLVEYKDLKTDDETEFLKEIVESLHIRPTPPETPVPEKFNLLEEVDAFHNDGWWVGVISKVLGGSKYMVYFRPFKEELEFEQKELRLHYDWIDGRWLRASQALGL